MKRIFLCLAAILLTAGCGERQSLSEETLGAVLQHPAPDSYVTSPLKVSGTARGSWFFEATLPVLLTDEEGNVIKSSFATAEGEWMTWEFVPFHAVIEFQTSAPSGYLILRKDNPSGLPENDAEIRMHLFFK